MNMRSIPERDDAHNKKLKLSSGRHPFDGPTAFRSGGAILKQPKENFWIGAKGGLLDRKHLDAMGEAVWLFLYFLMRQTQINDAGEGVVLYGNPLSRKSIAKDAGGWPERRIKDWTARLIKASYIRAVRAGNDGMIFFVRKAKSKTKNPKPSTRYFPVQCKEVGRKNDRLEYQDGRETVLSETEKRPTRADNSQVSQSDAHFPTTLTPKSLSNYNNTAAARTAAVVSLLSRKKSIPKAKTERELDERRRLLLRQSEQIKARYGVQPCN
jgi:hypothetical protein